jgi:hypothetical protein
MSVSPIAGRAGLVDDVVGVEVTVDGMLVIPDRLQPVDFPTALGIRPADAWFDHAEATEASYRG